MPTGWEPVRSARAAAAALTTAASAARSTTTVGPAGVPSGCCAGSAGTWPTGSSSTVTFPQRSDGRVPSSASGTSAGSGPGAVRVVAAPDASASAASAGAAPNGVRASSSPYGTGSTASTRTASTPRTSKSSMRSRTRPTATASTPSAAASRSATSCSDASGDVVRTTTSAPTVSHEPSA